MFGQYKSNKSLWKVPTIHKNKRVCFSVCVYIYIHTCIHTYIHKHKITILNKKIKTYTFKSNLCCGPCITTPSCLNCSDTKCFLCMFVTACLPWIVIGERKPRFWCERVKVCYKKLEQSWERLLFPANVCEKSERGRERGGGRPQTTGGQWVPPNGQTKRQTHVIKRENLPAISSEICIIYREEEI